MIEKEKAKEIIRNGISNHWCTLDILDAIDGAPQPKVGEWIPVSERLPEPILNRDIFNRPCGFYTVPVLVTVKSNEVDGTHTYTATDIMRGNTKEDMEWMMSCGYGGSAVYSQRIIAWQPKPEPYKEGDAK